MTFSLHPGTPQIGQQWFPKVVRQGWRDVGDTSISVGPAVRHLIKELALVRMQDGRVAALQKSGEQFRNDLGAAEQALGHMYAVGVSETERQELREVLRNEGIDGFFSDAIYTSDLQIRKLNVRRK